MWKNVKSVGLNLFVLVTLREITRDVGQKIRLAREECGLTQKDLASRLRLTPMGNL